MTKTRTYAAPTPNPETQAFWDAAEKGQFMVPKCGSCGKSHWYPRAYCPFCAGECTLQPSKGEGTIYSYSVMRVTDPKYVMAYVELAEGPKMLTNIVDADPDSLSVGQKVVVTFVKTEGGPPVPVFKPA